MTLYLRRVLVQTVAVWAMVRTGQVILALLARAPAPATLAPGSVVALAALVATIIWIDLRRRNLTLLLPNFGVPVAAILAAAAALTIGVEAVLALVVG
ncbi:MAG: hypothetical protein IT352_03720 [Gemmatimonadales bacterium]|nr:hypothetical protein [Gemmatimonadales bacterium]